MVCLIVLIPTNMAVFVNLTKSLIARAAITGMPLLRPKWSKGRVHTCGLYNAEIYSSVLGRRSVDRHCNMLNLIREDDSCELPFSRGYGLFIS